ncbi:MAG: aconitase X catalytic domain-containing protein [Thermoproteota archaeon]|nr:aconitase X catalytic domain-containing protein [Candidatus Brockarchaeota archaeon]
MKTSLNEKVFKKILGSLQTGKKEYIRISSAHLSGISYLNIGDAGLEFLEDLSKSGLKFRVKTTINPGCVDFDSPTECETGVFEKQKKIVNSLKTLGAIVSLTCTPYLFDNVVKKGQRIAWAESSAVLYANSIIGAHTNKEGSLTALASAILGYTARSGIHLRKGRMPEIFFEYQGELDDELDYGLLGYAIGLKAEAKTPYLRLTNTRNLHPTYLKQLLASFGTSGNAPLVWIEGVTPGFSKVRKPRRKIVLDRRELEKVRGMLSEELPSNSSEKIVFVTGCPHYSLEEIGNLSNVLKNVEKLSVEAWVFTSRAAYSAAIKKGLLRNLDEKGVRLFKDSCVMYCGLKKSNACVITNSVKAAYYLRNSFKLRTVLKSFNEFVNTYGAG